ncbi:MAG: hypothetical protein KIS66_02490 [Fimbriimonadaceae bacterium]|nr:hypothetical protein [Fimbriimonadaceae bacterium]
MNALTRDPAPPNAPRPVPAPTVLVQDVEVVYQGHWFTVEPEPTGCGARFVERGHGGREFVVRLANGREIVTRNLWEGDVTDARDNAHIVCARTGVPLRVSPVLDYYQERGYSAQILRHARTQIRALVRREWDGKCASRVFEGLDPAPAELWTREVIARDRKRHGVPA